MSQSALLIDEPAPLDGRDAAPPPTGHAADAARHLRTDALADSVLLLLVMTIGQRAVGFLRGVLLCRWLTPEQLGQWDLCWGFLLMAAPVAVLGLPGSFGRFADVYRQQGQLRTFLRRTGLACIALVLATIAMLLAGAPWLKVLLFGQDQYLRLTELLALCVAAVAAHNFMDSLFAGLRMYRVSSLLQAVHSFVFAALSLLLLCYWRTNVESVVLGYTLACVLTSGLGMMVLRQVWCDLPTYGPTLPARGMWARVMPFAMWLWITNWLYCLFELGDRYMIVHFSGQSAIDALNMVGQYHSSRVVPLLFVGLAEVLTVVVLPYLSNHWETRGRQEVSRQVNLTLKLVAFALSLGGVLVLLAGPLLFDVILQGKYAVGEQVLPLIIAFCVWAGMNSLATNYLLCAEKAHVGCLMLLVAVVLNLGLNYLWLPTLGLLGAVLATAVTRLVALLLTYMANARYGMRLESSMLVLTLLPALFYFGAWPTAAALAVAGVLAAHGNWLLSPRDKQDLLTALDRYRQRALGVIGR